MALTAAQERLAGGPVRRFVLANGFEVLTVDDSSEPRVAIEVAYRAGTGAAPAGHTELAHVVEHLLFNEMAPGAHGLNLLARLVDAGAAYVNGETAFDRTIYHEVVPAAGLAAALAVERARMTALRAGVVRAAVQRELRLVDEESRLHLAAWEAPAISDPIRQAIFPTDHVEGRTTRESALYFAATTASDVASFARRWYVPDRATLTLVGDLARAGDVRSLVVRAFGDVPRGGHEDPPPRDAWPALAGASPLVIEAEIDRPVVSRYWVVQGAAGVASEAVDCALRTLVGRVQAATGLTREGDVAVWHPFRDDRVRSIRLAPPGSTTAPDELRAQLDAQLARLGTEELPADDLERCQRTVARGIYFDAQTLRQRASYLQRVAHPSLWAADSGLRLGYVATMRGTDVRDAVQRDLALNRSLVAMVYPTRGAPPEGRSRASR